MTISLTLKRSPGAFKFVVWSLLRTKPTTELTMVHCIKRTQSMMSKSDAALSKSSYQRRIENAFLYNLCEMTSLTTAQERLTVSMLLFQLGRSVDEISWILSKPLASIHSHITRLFQETVQ